METLRTDLTAAMKAKETDRVRTLRAVIAAIQEEAVSGSQARELDDDEIQKVLRNQVKRRIEAADAFASAGRDEQAASERSEQLILETYLPAQLGVEELTALVEHTLTSHGWTEKKDMGMAIKTINQEVAGRAEGKLVADLVKARLS